MAGTELYFWIDRSRVKRAIIEAESTARDIKGTHALAKATREFWTQQASILKDENPFADADAKYRAYRAISMGRY